MLGGARRVLGHTDAPEEATRGQRYDAIILDALPEHIEPWLGLLDKEGFLVIRLPTAGHLHVLDRHGLGVLDQDGEIAKAVPAPAEVRALLRELIHLRAHAAQQRDGIAWLRSELAARETRGRARWKSLQRALSSIRHSARAARTRHYSRIVAGIGRRLPVPLKNLIKKVWDPWPQRQAVIDLPATALILPGGASSTYDVVCFSIIDWSFRWQRPQQLMSKMADAGHRVFYINTSQLLPPDGPAFQAEPIRSNVWEIRLAPPVAIDLYSGSLPAATLIWMGRMLEDLRREMGIVCAVSVVQVATWTAAAEAARERFGWTLVYDCMDEWMHFPGMRSAIVREEKGLVARADLVSVSGQRLLAKWESVARRIELVRNAADFDFFSGSSREDLLSGETHPIVGYFGAIAQWFDVGLVRKLAAARPDCTFVLVGGVFDVSVAALSRLPNVRLLGQQPYERMPSYLESFDVCIIPFVIDEITAATDPVKFYEYISLGKPVVTTSMPELAPYEELLYPAATPEHFLKQLQAALAEDDPSLRARRVELARQNTWRRRSETLRRAIREAHPKVSIIIVTYFNRELSRLCLQAVFHNSLHPNLEVIVVDNASRDGTPEMLEELAREHENLHVVLNDRNAGFATANNQGIRAATGQFIVLLNNDTVPARGWLPRLLHHLHDPAIGVVVAATNFSGNESRIAVPYTSLEDMPAFAEEYARAHEGLVFDIGVAAMYCVGLRRDVAERVGPLDEEFSVGMFEDDDYSHRVRLAGLRVVCAEDVFVHHFGQASFGKLPPEEYQAIWTRNQAYYERKWGVRWVPHTYR